MNDQNRPPPAFQEFAASMMARTDYRLLSLAERGLLYSLRLECWCNGSMPSDAAKLARVLGFDPADVAAALPSLEPFFDDADGVLTCPELDDYRRYLDERRAKQIEGGKLGAKRRYARKPNTDAGSSGVGNLQDTHRTTNGSLVQYSKVKTSTAKSNPARQRKEFDSVDDDWLNDYERATNE